MTCNTVYTIYLISYIYLSVFAFLWLPGSHALTSPRFSPEDLLAASLAPLRSLSRAGSPPG